MKYYLIALSLLLVFASCKKDEPPNLVIRVEANAFDGYDSTEWKNVSVIAYAKGFALRDSIEKRVADLDFMVTLIDPAGKEVKCITQNVREFAEDMQDERKSEFEVPITLPFKPGKYSIACEVTDKLSQLKAKKVMPLEVEPYHP